MLFSAPAIIIPPEKPAIVRASDLKDLPSWQEMQRRERAMREGSFPFPMFCPKSANGNDAYTVLLLHFDGSNGGTTFTDSSTAAHAFSVGGGSPVTSTTSPQFGAASLSLPGSAWITTPDSADFAFGTGDLTFDLWLKRSTTGAQKFWGQGNSGLTGGYHYAEFTAGNVLRFVMNDDTYVATAGTVTDTAWHHVAWERYGNNIGVALDGVFGASVSVTGITYTDSPGTFAIGRLGDYAASSIFTGNIDEFRVSKGIARYQLTNFTPPTVAYS